MPGTALSCPLAPRLSRPPFQRRGGLPNQGVAEPSPSSRESRRPPPPPSTPRALPPEAVWAPPGPPHQRPGHWGPCSGLPGKSLLSRGAGGSPPPSTRGQPGPADRLALQGPPPLAAELEPLPSKRMPSGRRLGCQARGRRLRPPGALQVNEGPSPGFRPSACVPAVQRCPSLPGPRTQTTCPRDPDPEPRDTQPRGREALPAPTVAAMTMS